MNTLLCCIAKTENQYIREFIEYYKTLGVSHICIFDNNDKDGERFESVIRDYIDYGFVTVIDYRGKKYVSFWRIRTVGIDTDGNTIGLCFSIAMNSLK